MIEHGIAFMGDGADINVSPSVPTMHMGLSFGNREMSHVWHDIAHMVYGYVNFYSICQRVGLKELPNLKKAIWRHTEQGTKQNLANQITLSLSWGQIRDESKDCIALFNAIEEHLKQTQSHENDYKAKVSKILIYRANFMDGLKMLDFLLRLDHEKTTDDELQGLVEQGRN